MSTNTTGWSLTGRLISKHFGALGDSLASMIAGFDPETATAADRDALADKLREVAAKYSQAKTAFDKEHGDLDSLRTQIAQDENVASALADRLTAGTVDEATANAFCDELEHEKASLAEHVQTESDAKGFMDELKAILDEMSDRLAKFDEQANKARAEFAAAQAQLDLQKMRQGQQDELRSLQGGGGSPTTAMSALQQRAANMKAQADAMKVVTDIGNRPAEAKASLDALRASVASGTTGTPSAMDRLKALSAKQPAAA
jgi:chromosome segregation ATPase